MRTLLTLAVLGVFGAAATGAPIPKEAKKTLPEKLMGEWRLVKTDAGVKPAYEFSIHFKKDGALEFHRQYPDREAIISKGLIKRKDGTNERFELTRTIEPNGTMVTRMSFFVKDGRPLEVKRVFKRQPAD